MVNGKYCKLGWSTVSIDMKEKRRQTGVGIRRRCAIAKFQSHAVAPNRLAKARSVDFL